MAYLVLRTPRIISRTSSITSVASTCIRNKPSLQIYRTNSSIASDPSIHDSLLPRPIDRSHETPPVTRARLLYQSRKRGILETDLLLSTFAHKHLDAMSETQMREYDQVIYPHFTRLIRVVVGRTRLGDILLGHPEEACPGSLEGQSNSQIIERTRQE
jgi:succinate dehydrogenase flavin-adding protein (antitoxin of CptAB toxin-antitoxin module)